MPSSPRLSRELTLLAATDLAHDEHLASLAAQTVQGSFDWARFLMLCAEHAMGPIAGARLCAVAPGIMPEFVAQPLRTSLR